MGSSDVIRQFASDSGTEAPSLITSTSLRKHISTTSQILNLKDNELDALANFLGHDVRVHREFYRLPENTVELAKISKLLLQLEAGNISKFTGKSLDEIDVTVDETIPVEEICVEEQTLAEQQVAAAELAEPRVSATAMTVTQNRPSSEAKKKTVRCSKVRKSGPRAKWSCEEKEAVARQLSKFLRIGRLPGKCECEEAKKK
jgi:hypothetical protein